MSGKAFFVREITVTDPVSGGDVELVIYREEGGAMLGVDASYLDQVMDEEDTLPSMYSRGHELELIDDVLDMAAEG